MTKILVVDDMQSQFHYAKLFLKDMLLGTQEFTYAKDKKEAMEQLQSQRFDLILMDMELTEQGHEGEELIKLIKAGEANQKTAIVGWSSNPDYEKAMLEAGADAFTCKRYIAINPMDGLKTAAKRSLQKAKERDPENYKFLDQAITEPSILPQRRP